MVNPMRNRMFEGDRSRRGRREVLERRRVHAISHVAKVGEPNIVTGESATRTPSPSKPKHYVAVKNFSKFGSSGNFQPPGRSAAAASRAAGTVKGVTSKAALILSEAGEAQNLRRSNRERPGKNFSVTATSRSDVYEVDVKSKFPLVSMKVSKKPRAIIFSARSLDQGLEDELAVPIPAAYDVYETRVVTKKMGEGMCKLAIPTISKGQKSMFDSNYEMFDENQKRTDGKRAALERAKFLREKYTDKIQGIGKWGEECEGDKSPLRKGRLVKVTTKVNQPEEDAVVQLTLPKEKPPVTSKVTDTPRSGTAGATPSRSRGITSKVTSIAMTLGLKDEIQQAETSPGGANSNTGSPVNHAALFLTSNKKEKGRNVARKITQIAQDGKIVDAGEKLMQNIESETATSFFAGTGENQKKKDANANLKSASATDKNTSPVAKCSPIAAHSRVGHDIITTMTPAEEAARHGSGLLLDQEAVANAEREVFSQYTNVKKHQWEAEVNCRFKMEMLTMPKIRTIAFTCKDADDQARSMRLVVPQYYDVERLKILVKEEKKLILVVPQKHGYSNSSE